MSNSRLNIPVKIKVGFNNRSDTYTGKLAYVIYYDEKGVLRKENSWESWRDKKIEPQEYDNVPTSGFVLNKKVGDYRSDWNHRSAAVRVYDPRNFEFEISVENLLYILQECTSTKGKGLEGEFVYAWDGTTLVLLPVSSVEYQQSKIFTAHKLSKVTKDEMVVGCTYLTKDMENVMYLGREDYYEINYNYEHGNNASTVIDHKCKGKRHIFVYINGKAKGYYLFQSGFTKIAARLSSDVSPEFPTEFEKYKQSINGSPIEFKIERNMGRPDYNSLIKGKNNEFFLFTSREGEYDSLKREYVDTDNLYIFYTNTLKPSKDLCVLTRTTRDGYGKPDQIVHKNNLELYRLVGYNSYGQRAFKY